MARTARKISKTRPSSRLTKPVPTAIPDPAPQASDPRIQLSLTLLQENSLAPGIRIKDIAARVHITSSHLRHLFKRDVGMSPTHYVKLLRLRRAKELLESTFLSVKEVMAAVGFADPSHFVREYKTEYGETPSQTRALARIT